MVPKVTVPDSTGPGYEKLELEEVEREEVKLDDEAEFEDVPVALDDSTTVTETVVLAADASAVDCEPDDSVTVW